MKRIFLIFGLLFFSVCAVSWASELEVVEESAPAAVPAEATVSIPVVESTPVVQSAIEAPVASEAQSTAKEQAVVTEQTMVKAADDLTPKSTKKTMPMPPAVLPLTGEATRYTLGPDDVIEIIVRRHPEFSGQYPINGEGKIQYKFVGDIEIKGLTKTEVKDKIVSILGKFIINPDIDVSILEYRSKVIYVIGEVGSPGKYYMKTDKISLREAVVQAGLPTLSAAMRRTQLVRPDAKGKPVTKIVDLYALLYEGKLNLDLEMMPGDVLVVPATLWAKMFRVVSPVTTTVSNARSVTPY